MEYTVKEIAELTGVTIKTLYHYHKIGLLLPCKITEAGYRLYGTGELERLQQILFYRELDFSLKDIKKALEDEPSRLECLTKQHNLLNARRQRMDCLLKTIEESIHFTRKGVNMDKTKMFTGLNKEEWKEALLEQNEYLKDKYEFDMIKKQVIKPDKLNAQAAEAIQFTSDMIKGLKNGWKPNDDRIQNILKDHIAYLNENVNSTDADTFVNTAKFMIHDDFHRNMLESQQTGLSYYLYAAAELYAEKSLNN
ncbi:MerR family transcriptional regulator [Anaerocolumna sedimenticola]|uniref:MerR family transcriptional regulator n=1 Tax=Anaerocolumna sedimenticola TaxID=2696063 RepID=A0A6P1TJ48_9FIRM|nr:MerR family transcriptional regulator [Anaerocolumna sedimenticola]QHQ60463.1 MerR family transcriptional regulator [Anaerocolumna sedimenticola]